MLRVCQKEEVRTVQESHKSDKKNIILFFFMNCKTSYRFRTSLNSTHPLQISYLWICNYTTMHESSRAGIRCCGIRTITNH